MSTTVRSKVRRRSLRNTLLLFSVALVVVPAVTLGALATVIGYQSRIREAQDEIVGTAAVRQREVERWIGEREADLSVLAADEQLRDSMRTMRGTPEEAGDPLLARWDAVLLLSSFLSRKAAFEEFYVMDPESGAVEVSTQVAREGEEYPSAGYFLEAKERVYLQPPLYDDTIAASTILIAGPVTGLEGELLAVLVGRVSLDQLGTLLESGLLEGEQSYLVSGERRYLAGSAEMAGGAEGTIENEGIVAALEGGQGSGRYASYSGEPVLAAYRWVPVLQAALLVERDWSQIAQSAWASVLLPLGITVLAIAVASGAALLLTQRIVGPIVDLTEAATQIAGGDLERVAPVQRADEIGVLARAFNTMTAQLRESIGELEQRVAERTLDLRRRAGQLEAASAVARDATAIRDVDALLNETVSLVSEKFGFYHAGVFLVDDPREYAVLRAASSAGGQRMLDRGHRLRVGEVGIVGYVAGSGEPRIALDVGSDAVFFDNPDLPRTRSEMAVPLKIRGDVIGVLDVQSTDEAAFDEADVAVLQTMADQVAVAIENARLLETSQGALRELQLAYGEQVGRGWRQGGRISAFEYDRVDVRPSDLSYAPVIDRALSSGSVQAMEEPGNGRSALAAPLLLRDQAIGAITLEETDEGHAWTEDEMSLVREVSDQVALALESARLFEEARLRAHEQSVLSDLGRALTAQLSIEEILQVAYQRASDLIDTTSFYVGLYDPDEHQLVVHLDTSGDQADRRGATRSANGVLSDYVVRTRRPLVVPSDLPEWLSKHGVALVGEPPVSWLGVPLTVGEEVLGVMAVQGQSGQVAYDEHDLDLLTTVGSQTAIALQSARLYEEALETAERLREVDRLKSQFLANMSHELRTPLNSIIGFSRVVLKEIDGPITDRQKEDLEAIHSSGQHLLGLINDILDVSKIEAGKMELDFETVDLRELVNGVMSTAVALVKDKPIELQRAIPDTLPVITADERRVRQVLLNLISNAAKFTMEGFICVGAEAEGGEVILSVADSGIGIEEQQQERIFEPFTQTDASTTREHGGTGLGLTITRSFVELHGGRIWVDSEPGAGSTFYVALPIEGPASVASELRAPETVAEAPAADRPQKAEPGRLVLCVDDDTGVINLYRRYLNQRGYRVFGLTDSRRAIDVAKRLQPYAITLDVMMPRKDGWEVMQELKADPATRDIPVIVCSIVSEAERGLSLGAADYLVKPIMEEDLVATLDRLDRSPGAQRVVVDDYPGV